MSGSEILEYEPGDLTCIVESGLRLSALQAALDLHGQRFSLDPPGDPTLGECLLENLSGPLSHRFGTMRDLVLGVTVVLPDGTRASSGGKVVKNVAGFDVAKLLVGSLGTLAVITEVAFRLHPVPAASRTVALESRSVLDLCTFATRLGRMQVTPSVVDLHWPEGVVLARFDSSDLGATVQAERVTAELGGRILTDAEQAALTTALVGSPWTGDGLVGALAVLPSRVGEFLSSMSATCDAVALRPLLGTGDVRFAPEARDMVASAVRAIGGRLVIRRGYGITAGEAEDGVALDLMRSVKRQLDPARTLSPGRQVGGI